MIRHRVLASVRRRRAVVFGVGVIPLIVATSAATFSLSPPSTSSPARSGDVSSTPTTVGGFVTTPAPKGHGLHRSSTAEPPFAPAPSGAHLADPTPLPPPATQRSSGVHPDATSPVGPPTALDYSGSGAFYDAPDPSYTLDNGSTTEAEIYATGSSPENNANIFTQPWAVGTSSVGEPFDALETAKNASGGSGPGGAAYLQPVREFAPSVAYIGNQYVMWFSGENTDGQPNCLEVATSPDPAGQFTVQSAWCDDNAGVGDFDPSIISDYGEWWLVFSEEEPATQPNFSNFADDAVVELDSTGTTIETADCMTIVAYLSNVTDALPSVPIGTNPQLENPDFEYDYSNGTAPDGNPIYADLTNSFGSYADVNSYHTVQIMCEQIIGPCYDSDPVLEDASILNGANLQNPQGLSTSPDTNYNLLAATSPNTASPRGMFFEPSTTTDGNIGPINNGPTQDRGYYTPQQTASP